MTKRVPISNAGGEDAARPAPLVRVAFYDIDGTLVKGNVIHHYLFYALNDRTPTGRIRRIAELVAKAPRYAALNRLDRRAFNEEFYRSFAGISRDRLEILSKELFERVIEPNMYEGARELIETDRKNGFLPFLVTGALDLVAKPLAKALGIAPENVASNRLAYGPKGVATGEVIPPVLAGPGKATFLRALAAERGFDLERSRVYADDVADLPFLSSVGHPVATNPSAKLRATAKAHGWPILDLQAAEKAGFFDRALDGTLSVLRILESSL